MTNLKKIQIYISTLINNRKYNLLTKGQLYCYNNLLIYLYKNIFITINIKNINDIKILVKESDNSFSLHYKYKIIYKYNTKIFNTIIMYKNIEGFNYKRKYKYNNFYINCFYNKNYNYYKYKSYLNKVFKKELVDTSNRFKYNTILLYIISIYNKIYIKLFYMKYNNRIPQILIYNNKINFIFIFVYKPK